MEACTSSCESTACKVVEAEKPHWL